MNSRIISAITITVLLFLPTTKGEGGTSHAVGKDLESIFEDRIYDCIDIGTGRLKKMSLGELKKIISLIAPFHETGGHIRPDSFVSFSYRFEGAATGETESSSLGFEVLADGEGADFEKYVPVNIRLTYRSPSGTLYYNSIMATPWLNAVDRKRDLYGTGTDSVRRDAKAPPKG